MHRQRRTFSQAYAQVPKNQKVSQPKKKRKCKQPRCGDFRKHLGNCSTFSPVCFVGLSAFHLFQKMQTDRPRLLTTSMEVTKSFIICNFYFRTNSITSEHRSENRKRRGDKKRQSSNQVS